MPVKLTGGALLSICQGDRVENPVLQILGNKKINGSSSDRYRLLISDGDYSNSFAMLATQMNDKIHNGQLENYTVVSVKKYVCNNMQGKKVIILLDIDISTPGAEIGEKLGNPRAINPDGTVNEKPSSSGGNSSSSNQKRYGDDAGLNAPPSKKTPLAPQNPPRSSILDPRPVIGSSSTPSTNIMPINSLTPYQNKWTIQGRVTNKSDIRRWSNSRGEGHLFSFDVLDASGSIKIAAFKELCDKFFNLIEIGKVYYISQGVLKAANKQFNNTNNDYEITLKDTSEVSLCTDADKDVPTISFDFVKIADLAKCAKDSIVDIIGIVKVCNESVQFTSQRTQKEMRKRDLTFVDTSLTEVNVTVWGTMADTFEGSNFPVVAIKGAKVSDYNGVSLSTLISSTVQMNPDIPQAHKLKGWFESEGSNIETTSLTQSQLGRSNNMDSGSEGKTIGEVKYDNLGSSTEKPDYYSTQALISMFQKDKALYQACNRVSEGRACNKKVVDNNGSYRCEKCNVDNDEFNWRIILNLLIVDSTDSQWVNCFQESAESILGVSAQDLGHSFQHDEEKYNQIFKEANFKTYNFRIRCKADNYNGESKSRHTIMSLSPVNYEENNNKLIQELKQEGVDISSIENSMA
ncbi:replication protein A 70 kDa DNA-binding subunit [Lepeophtheirus salmonis]|uniref:replication protein A 70 kDa DNA-binding subunit n=1 Tax=Lepeophtheirus salmonis TaxID=72036 RepID=UPI001AE17BC4|nr:replication protein A 70 kDa DNA-binding subunit-like [Lepeophtheirus salmonis]